MDGKNKLKIGEIFVKQGYILSHQLEEALKEQKVTGEKVGEFLIRKGWLTQQELEEALKTPGIHVFDPNTYIIDSEVIKLVPKDFAIQYKLLPIFKKDDILTVAMADPTDMVLIDKISLLTPVCY